jgi:hypothetical protein
MNSEVTSEAPKVETIADPWVNRSEGMRCKTCISFVVKVGSSRANPNGKLGRCRAHAPTIKGFVPVFEMDWCGDHRLDENKI